MQHFFETLPFAGLTRALCWTFAHSLWQGLAAAILAAIVIRCTRTARPQLRYGLLGALLMLLAGAAVVTFLLELGNAGADTIPVGGNTTAGNAVALPVMQPASDTSFIAVVRNGGSQLLHQWSGLLAGLWFLIFWIKSIRLMSSLNGVRLLRTRGVSLPDESWTALVARLAASLQLRRRIVLLESVLVDMPVVIGFLKPVLLVPAGLLTGLPPAQAEAILLHELAHIRRHDYLINLLQRSLELVFHFNPFLLWISGQLRREREACCDAMAVSVTCNREALVGALITFGERQLRPSGLALGFGGGQLLDRVKRVAYNRSNGLGRAESVLAALGLVFLVSLAFAFRAADVPAAARRVSPAAVRTITIATSNMPPEQDSVQVAGAIEAFLISNRVVRREELISFRLDERELVVNGIRQPAGLHRALRSQYLLLPGARIEYHIRPAEAQTIGAA